MKYRLYLHEKTEINECELIVVTYEGDITVGKDLETDVHALQQF